jgi:hypothetical protein
MAFDEPAVGVVVMVCVRIEPLRVTTWTLVTGVPVILVEGDFVGDWVAVAAMDEGVVVDDIYKELSSVTVVSTSTGSTVVFVPGVEEGEGEEKGVEVEYFRPAELVDDGFALLEEAPAVPEGLRFRAMYPNRPLDEPQRSDGNPGHGSLQLLVDCWLLGI